MIISNWYKLWGAVLTISGFIACPCHLPLTLPLLLAVLGGTGIGGIIASNVNLLYGITAGYFIVGVGVGLYLMNRHRKTVQRVEENSTHR